MTWKRYKFNKNDGCMIIPNLLVLWGPKILTISIGFLYTIYILEINWRKDNAQ